MHNVRSLNLATAPLPLEKKEPQKLSLCQIVIQKICQLFKAFIGYFLRICVFQLGVYHKSCLSKALVQCYASEKVDFKRMEQSAELLEKIGGKRQTIITQDGLKLDGMWFTQHEFQKAIHSHGGQITQHWVLQVGDFFKPLTEAEALNQKSALKVTAIEGPNSDDWKGFCKGTLCKFGWQEATFKTDEDAKQVFIIDSESVQNVKEKSEESQCFIRCHSPAISYAFERKYVAKHLGIGQDVFLFDYRGTYKSEGTPSESGYYLDGEAVIDHLKPHYRYDKLWVTGFCGGVGVAAHLKKKFHSEGMNLVAENPFNTLDKMMLVQPIGWLGVFARETLQNPEIAHRYQVEEDGFDNLRKFQELSEQGRSKVIVINTATDKKVPPESAKELFDAAAKTCHAFHLTHEGFKPKADGHDDQPLQNPRIWDEYREVVLYSK